MHFLDAVDVAGAESSWATEQAVNGVNGVSPALVKESSSSMQSRFSNEACISCC